MQILTAIVDIKANAFVGPLQLFRQEAAAIRFFKDVALHPEGNINKYMEDYNLVALATIDDDTLELTAIPPYNLITGQQLRAATENNRPHSIRDEQ